MLVVCVVVFFVFECLRGPFNFKTMRVAVCPRARVDPTLQVELSDACPLCDEHAANSHTFVARASKPLLSATKEECDNEESEEGTQASLVD